jgi:hypothetical protein
MNWGTKIALIYGGFVAFVIAMVVLCVKQNDIHLVSKEYYKEEIAYQDQIDKLTNTQQLHGQMGFQYIGEKQEVEFFFPKSLSDATGEILFFRPSDARKDVKIAVNMDEAGKQIVPVSSLNKGLWKVKVKWNAQNKDYFSEQVLIIN